MNRLERKEEINYYQVLKKAKKHAHKFLELSLGSLRN